MAIIKTCCFTLTLRKGCYVSATFSLIYFFLFTWITGSMMIGSFQQLFNDQSMSDIYKDMFVRNMNASFIEQQQKYYAAKNNKNNNNNDNNNNDGNNPNVESAPPMVKHGQQQQQQHLQHQQRQHVIARTSPVASFPATSSDDMNMNAPLGGNDGGGNLTKRTTSSPGSGSSSQPDFTFTVVDDQDNASVLQLILTSEAYSIAQTVILVLDLACEVAGVYSSILLIRGLQQENKSWFWPWMIVVPTHIAIDVYTMGGIVMEYFVAPMQTPLSLVLMTVTVDIVLNSINAYGLICVISQYQEYKAGRGTAAYVEFTSQTPMIMLETTSNTKTVLNQPLGNNRRKSGKDYNPNPSSRVGGLNNEKSDSCCEEFTMPSTTTTTTTTAATSTFSENTEASKANGRKENGSVVVGVGINIRGIENGQANGIIMKADEEMDNNGNNESHSHAHSHSHSPRSIIWKENTSSSCEDDSSTITQKSFVQNEIASSSSSSNNKDTSTNKFGKFLAVRKSSLSKKKQNNQKSNQSQSQARVVKFDQDEDHSRNNWGNQNCSKHSSQEEEEEEEEVEEEEEHSVAGLSAFGIITC